MTLILEYTSAIGESCTLYEEETIEKNVVKGSKNSYWFDKVGFNWKTAERNREGIPIRPTTN